GRGATAVAAPEPVDTVNWLRRSHRTTAVGPWSPPLALRRSAAEGPPQGVDADGPGRVRAEVAGQLRRVGEAVPELAQQARAGPGVEARRAGQARPRPVRFQLL